MLKRLLPLLITLPTLAQANQLKLSGTGEAKYASGKSYACSEIFLDLEIKNDSLTLHQGGYICGFLQAGFDSFQMDIRQGKLWHLDQQLGTISQDKIEYQVYDASDNSTYFFSLQKQSSTYRYFEEWHDGEKIALKIEGELKRPVNIEHH